MKQKSYEDRLEMLAITSLEKRRVRGDMIQVFRIVKSFDLLNWPRYTLLCIFQDGGRRHLGFVIRRFWTTHDVPVAGFYVTCQWRNDQLEFIRDIMILPFHDFGCKIGYFCQFWGFGRF